MELEDLLAPNSSPIDLRSEDRWGAIDELVSELVATRRIQPNDQAAVAAALKHREMAMTTGIGYEIGIPHASTHLVTEVVGVIGRSRKGINFEALDGKPVKLVVLFLVPAGELKKHLNTLANIARLLQQEDFRQGLWQRLM
ncbi:MAG TPA: PTS sugar transporter subunit IIA [Verrucomicrobiae bacterium]